MSIYVAGMSAPTAGGGIQTFIDPETWELFSTGVDDFLRPVTSRASLVRVLQEWLLDPDDAAYDGRELAELIANRSSGTVAPTDLAALVKRILER